MNSANLLTRTFIHNLTVIVSGIRINILLGSASGSTSAAASTVATESSPSPAALPACLTSSPRLPVLILVIMPKEDDRHHPKHYRQKQQPDDYGHRQHHLQYHSCERANVLPGRAQSTKPSVSGPSLTTPLNAPMVSRYSFTWLDVCFYFVYMYETQGSET